MEVTENIIVALVGVVGTLAGTAMGWGLTQISEKLKYRKRIGQQKVAIYIELGDCTRKLNEAAGYLLDICGSVCSPSPSQYIAYPTHIQLPITTKNFFEIYIYFAEAERANIAVILDYAFSYNDALKQAEAADEKKMSADEYLDHLLFAYASAMTMKAFAELTLKNKSKKVLYEDPELTAVRTEIKNKYTELKTKLAKRFNLQPPA